MDGWLLTHVASDGETNGSFTMGYYEQEDIPFHWALAKAFTLADNYHCSVMGPTDPNRIFWENGSNDPQGKAGGPVLETGGVRDLTFESGRRDALQRRDQRQVLPGDRLAADTITCRTSSKFQTPGLVPDRPVQRRDVDRHAVRRRHARAGSATRPTRRRPATRTWPSRRTAPTACCPTCRSSGTSPAHEHPPAIPAAGAQFLATKLEALAANEDLWNTTVFVINYDENDGFFDHVVPPTPNPSEYPEEFVTLASPAGTPGGGLPVGAGLPGPRLHHLPWTVGGQIFSEVSDHTSCLRLIEAVAAAGGLSGKGPVTFPSTSAAGGGRPSATSPGPCARSRPQPAPSNTQFDPATTAANPAAQTTAALQPMPPRPAATQDFPYLPKEIF